MSWTSIASGIGDIFSSTWDGIKNNGALLGAIAGGVDAYTNYAASESAAKSNKDYLNYKKGILAKHNETINAGPKEKPKQVYRV